MGYRHTGCELYCSHLTRSWRIKHFELDRLREAEDLVSKDQTRTMPLMGHLTELRKRLTYVAIVVVVVRASRLRREELRLRRPHAAAAEHAVRDQKLFAFSATESFMAMLKISIYAGLLISLPVHPLAVLGVHHAGALREREEEHLPVRGAVHRSLPRRRRVRLLRRAARRSQVACSTSARASSPCCCTSIAYVSFISLFLLAFGVVFELPLIMMLLAWAGIVDYKKMRKYRKYAVLVEAVIAMVITPSQDPVSMMLMLDPAAHPVRVRHLAGQAGRQAQGASGRKLAPSSRGGGDTGT